MSEHNVTNMANVTGDNTRWSIIQMLEKAIEDLKENPDAFDQAVLLLQRKRDGRLNYDWYASNISHSDICFLCSFVEHDLLAEIRESFVQGG